MIYLVPSWCWNQPSSTSTSSRTLSSGQLLANVGWTTQPELLGVDGCRAQRYGGFVVC